jgi:hypothetical protein
MDKLFVYYLNMDAFTELLESFSKLKKRQLRLLKENSNPESEAQQAFAQAKGSNPPPVLAKPFITSTSKGTQVAVYQKKDGSWKGSIYSNGKVLGGRNEVFIDQEWGRFVGFFKGEGISNSNPNKGADAGQNIANSPMAMDSPEDAMAAQESFQNIALTLPEVYSGLDKKFIQPLWSNFQTFGTYVFGKTPQSLEMHTLNIKTKILFDEATKQYLSIPTPPDPQNTKDVAKALEFLFDCLAKNNLSEDDKLKLKKSFSINSNGHVSVFTDLDDSGLVFSDNTSFFKNLLNATEEKYQLKFRRLDVKKEISQGIDNHIRGVALEEILPILCMQRKLEEFASMGLPNDALKAAIQGSVGLIKDRLLKLMQNYESWVMAHDQSALDSDDVKVVNAVGSLLGNNGSKLISAIVAASKDAVSVRQPDFILTKGREVGEGRRQDTFEIFGDFNKAKMALIKMGYSDQEIMLNGMIKNVRVEEAFAGKEDQLAIALGSGLFKAGQPVFYTPISLKNYLSLDKTQLGTALGVSTSDFIKGKSKDPLNLFRKKFEEIGGPSFQTIQKKIVKYNTEVEDIWDKVGKVPIKVMARSDRGNLVQSTPFKEFISNTLDIIKANSTYEEMNDVSSEDNPKAKLTVMIRKYIEAGDEDTNELLASKIKAYTAQYTKNAKLIADINAGKPEAKHYLAMKMFNAAGSVDDGLVCDYRGLATGEKYNFKQNDVVKEVISSFLNDDKMWVLKAKNNTFIFYSALNPDIRFTLIDKVEKTNELTGEVKYQSKTVAYVNKPLLQKYNRRKSSRESMIETWMSYQKVILEGLVG